MKYIILYVLSAGFILFGIVGFIVTMEELKKGNRQNLFVGIIVPLSFLVIGALMILAARVKYTIGSPSVIGLALAFFGVAMVAMELDNLAKGKTKDLLVSLVVAVIFLVSGILLIKSGHQHNIKTLKDNSIEHIQNKSP